MESIAEPMTMEQIFKDFHVPIHRYINKLLDGREPEVADDLTSDTFLKVLRALQNRPVPEYLSAWIYRIALNTTVDYIRRKKRFKMLDVAEPSIRGILFDEKNDTEKLERDIYNEDLLRRIFRHIPKRYAIALYLYHFQGLSYPEVARRLDVKDTAIKMLLSRALQSCRRAKDRFDADLSEKRITSDY